MHMSSTMGHRLVVIVVVHFMGLLMGMGMIVGIFEFGFAFRGGWMGYLCDRIASKSTMLLDRDIAL
jgi:hypothetical protein